MSAALTEALYLAAGGIPIFPCYPDGHGNRPDGRPYYKSPRIAGWQLYASADEAVIRQWWQQWPDSMVAVPTGQRSGLYVLDLDVKPAQGVNGIATLQAAGLVPPRTRAHMTLTGGMHLLYALPATGAAKTDAGMLGAGVDRRGDGGYIIWWPAHGGQVTAGAIAACPQWMVGDASRDGMPDDTLPPMGLAEHELHDLLRRIPPDSVAGRSEWLRVGMALHHEYEGAEAGLVMWNAYSMLWPNYDGEHVLRREWDTFGRTQRVAVTMRSYVPQGWRSVPAEVAFAGGVVVQPQPVPQAASAAPYFVPNLPMAVVDARDGTATSRPLSEAGNAQRMHDLYRDKLRYVPETKSWLYWTDGMWLGDPDSNVPVRLALGIAGHVYAEGQNNIHESAIYVKWARKSSELRVARAAVAILATYPDMRLSAAMLNTDIMLAGLNGGRQVIELRNGRVRDARPTDYVTKSFGAGRVGQVDGSARWLQFVSEIFGGNAELIDWMQRWCGYCLTGSTQEEMLVFAYGMGRNGKGTFFETVAHVLGEYAATVDKSTFQESRGASGGAASPDIAKLQGARMVLSSETAEDTPIDEAQIKNITGGDQITARGLFKDPITFLPQFKVAISGNHKPIIRSTDHGTWSRIRMVPFLRIFTEPDKTLKARFREDAHHILAWMLQGCLEWQRRGLGDVPEVVSDATSRYKIEMDVIGTWIKDRCVRDDRAITTAALLYSSYRNWAEQNGYKTPMTAQAFGRRLSDRGFTSFHGRNGSQWIGISIAM